MLPKILLISGLSVLGGAALLFCIYLLLIRTKKAHDKIAAYRGVNLAHRGLHGEGAAENSMTAFRRAKEAGFGVELDVRLSKDGELVVFHDDTLTRVAGVEGRVDELTLAELRDHQVRLDAQRLRSVYPLAHTHPSALRNPFGKEYVERERYYGHDRGGRHVLRLRCQRDHSPLCQLQMGILHSRRSSFLGQHRVDIRS